jgi:hypothetical protein
MLLRLDETDLDKTALLPRFLSCELAVQSAIEAWLLHLPIYRSGR